MPICKELNIRTRPKAVDFTAKDGVHRIIKTFIPASVSVQVADHKSEHPAIYLPGLWKVQACDVMHVADPAVLGVDVDEIYLASQGIAVGLYQKGLGADEVVGAGGNEKGTGVTADEGARGHGFQVLPVLVAGTDEPSKGALGETAPFSE